MNFSKNRDHKNRGGIGCGTIIAVFSILSFLVSIAILGGSIYFAMEMSKDPRAFLEEHQVLVRKLGRTVVSVFNSEKPLAQEVIFDADAYNSFLQKQGELAQGFQNVQDEYPFDLVATAPEILSFLKQDLASWDIRHYNLEFDKDRVKFSASIPGELLVQRIPAHMPPVFKESLETLDYLNIQGDMNFLFDDGIKTLRVNEFSLGSIRVADVFMQMFNSRLGQETGGLEHSLSNLMDGIQVTPSKIELRKGEIFLSGVSTQRSK